MYDDEKPDPLSAQEFLCALHARAMAKGEPYPFTGLPQDRPIEGSAA